MAAVRLDSPYYSSGAWLIALPQNPVKIFSSTTSASMADFDSLVPASIHEASQVAVAYLPFEKFKASFALVFAEVREEFVDRWATDALATRLGRF